jgi:hypothetical protein
MTRRVGRGSTVCATSCLWLSRRQGNADGGGMGKRLWWCYMSRCYGIPCAVRGTKDETRNANALIDGRKPRPPPPLAAHSLKLDATHLCLSPPERSFGPLNLEPRGRRHRVCKYYTLPTQPPHASRKAV